MKLERLEEIFSICKVKEIPQESLQDGVCFIAKTDEEISLVCTAKRVPAQTLARDDGWRGFRIQGILDFSLIGILSEISTVLARNHIGIFAISTYNTDYIFTKEGDYQRAIRALLEVGYEIL